MKDLFENMGLETVPFPPTPSFKLARSHDPATSHDAAESITASHMEQVVLEKIEDFGSDGCISDQVLAALPHYGYSTVTANARASQAEASLLCGLRSFTMGKMMGKFFVIEKNVPLPEERPDPAAHYDVVPKMKAGDSILVKNTTQK